MRKQEPLSRLHPGMTPEEVVRLMQGKPYAEDNYMGKKGEEVLVYKYPTHPVITIPPGPISDPHNLPPGVRVVYPMGIFQIYQDEELTPLIFVNNVLKGWGWSYLGTASKKYEFVVKFKIR